MGRTRDSMDFVVVGAGLAGLRTAVDLQDRGMSVAMFEARQRVGGRVSSGVDPGGGDGGDGELAGVVCDLGGQWFGPGQTHVLALVDRLGLHAVPTAVPGRAIWCLDGHRKLGNSRRPPISVRALAEVVIAGVHLSSMLRSVHGEEPWKSRHAAAWDAISAEDWIRARFRTGEGRAVARLIIEGNMAVAPSDTSLLGLLFDMGTATSLRRLASAEAFRLREGTYELARRLALPVHDRIKFGEPVRAIRQDGSGVHVASDTSVVRCRRVAVCVPPALANGIEFDPPLPEQRAAYLDRTPMGSCVKFHAVYGHPFWRSRQLSGQVFSADHLVALTYDNSPEGDRGPGVIVGLVVADRAKALGRHDPQVQECEILECLGELFGAAATKPRALVVKDWGSEEWTRGAYAACFAPSVWTTVGSSWRKPCGRVHWAGTETSAQWYGYMEGALRSGTRVVHEMLDAG